MNDLYIYIELHEEVKAGYYGMEENGPLNRTKIKYSLHVTGCSSQ